MLRTAPCNAHEVEHHLDIQTLHHVTQAKLLGTGLIIDHAQQRLIPPAADIYAVYLALNPQGRAVAEGDRIGQNLPLPADLQFKIRRLK